MTLQDDITRYATENTGGTLVDWVAKNIAAGLERDYYLVKLADLPEVVDAGGGYGRCGLIGTPPGFSAETSRQRALEYLAVAEHLEARESESATLARRRDELARQYGNYMTYDMQSTMTKDLIDRLIYADADYTDAAEAAS